MKNVDRVVIWVCWFIMYGAIGNLLVWVALTPLVWLLDRRLVKSARKREAKLLEERARFLEARAAAAPARVLNAAEIVARADASHRDFNELGWDGAGIADLTATNAMKMPGI